jgi:colanic acid/amylovoran biosynthesis glycosyltransferase
MAELKKRGLSFEYRIIGDGDEAEALTFAIHQLALADCVYLLGKKSPEEVKSYYETAHIYLQPSVQEGFCNAVLEAQCMGLMCIVSDAEGLSENVDHGKSGWIFPRRDHIELAKTIEAAISLSDEEKLNRSKRASSRITESFDLTRQTQAFVDFYNTL